MHCVIMNDVEEVEGPALVIVDCCGTWLAYGPAKNAWRVLDYLLRHRDDTVWDNPSMKQINLLHQLLND
jgi:hypothetical protein